MGYCLYVGIDPGKEGGVAIVSSAGVHVCPMPETKRQIADLFKGIPSPQSCRVYIEEHGTRPGQATRADASYAKHWGFLEGVLVALGLPYEVVTVRNWQKEMLPGKPSRPDRAGELNKEIIALKVKKPKTEEDKERMKELKKEHARILAAHRKRVKDYAIDRAQAAFPQVNLLATERSKVPHSGMADALLLARYNQKVG